MIKQPAISSAGNGGCRLPLHSCSQVQQALGVSIKEVAYAFRLVYGLDSMSTLLQGLVCVTIASLCVSDSILASGWQTSILGKPKSMDGNSLLSGSWQQRDGKSGDLLEATCSNRGTISTCFRAILKITKA